MNNAAEVIEPEGDALAYELRRLIQRIGASRQAIDPAPLRPAGELALRLAKLFRLRTIDVDVALVVLASELDLEFRKLLGTPDELGILAALLPHVEGAISRGRDGPAPTRDAPRGASEPDRNDDVLHRHEKGSPTGQVTLAPRCQGLRGRHARR